MPPPSCQAPFSASLRVSLACHLDQVRAAAQTVRAFLKQQACSAAEQENCELALVEACNNAILYAGQQKHQAVEIEALCGERDIELRVTDHTPGFEWPARVSLPSPESERGRGLFLILAVMSSATYTRGPAGNTLVLRKSRSRPT